jgi:hypothetical protein
MAKNGTNNGDTLEFIDDAHGVVTVAKGMYYSSELLFAVDQDTYRAVGSELRDAVNVASEEVPE